MPSWEARRHRSLSGGALGGPASEPAGEQAALASPEQSRGLSLQLPIVICSSEAPQSIRSQGVV